MLCLYAASSELFLRLPGDFVDYLCASCYLVLDEIEQIVGHVVAV